MSGPAGAWALVETVCRGGQVAEEREPEGPDLDALVLREWRALRIPPARAIVQPAERTLVHLPTIFHTTTGEQEFPLTLLGRDVVLYAIPVSYQWTFADGATETTSGPGSPYPSMEITHTYTDTGTTRVRVDVTYRAEFTVDGGARRPVPGQTTVTGTTDALRIMQARTRLVDNS